MSDEELVERRDKIPAPAIAPCIALISCVHATIRRHDGVWGSVPCIVLISCVDATIRRHDEVWIAPCIGLPSNVFVVVHRSYYG